MDKIKPYLKQAKKHYFWIFSALVFLLAVGSWYYATSDLAEQTDTRKLRIDSSFSQLQAKLFRNVHPNPTFVTETQKINNQQAANVMRAWNEMFTKQKDRVMLWPAALEKYRETLARLEPQAQIPEHLREAYRNHAERNEPTRLKKRLRLVEAYPKTEEQLAAEIAAAGGSTKDINRYRYDGVVEYPEFDNIFATLKWSSTPTTWQVRYAQEDIWVYTALFDAIRQTNGDSVATPDGAAIKRILSVQIGKQVPAPSTPILDKMKEDAKLDELARAAEMAARAATYSGDDEYYEDDYYEEEYYDEFSGISTPSVSIDESLRDNRYVNLDGVPVAASETYPYPEFVLMPVKLAVIMNQRYLPVLLGNCAKNDLPIMVDFDLFQVPKKNQNSKVKVNLINEIGQRQGQVDGPHKITDDDIIVVLRGYCVIYRRPDPTALRGYAPQQGSDLARGPRSGPPRTSNRPSQPTNENPVR
ncbi:Hypothetical protein PBC10988_11690 [Planctomycetales bacterium 10988]|nr:Hypothetical protein PBC10988_11690 [Planctomycetales bacterium 10988]